MKILVIKCGGSIINQLPSTFYTDLVQMHKSGEIQPVIIHGGGPSISSLLDTLKIESTFVAGLRKTTEPVLEVVEMILSGSMNKHIVRQIIQAKGNGFGISGIDGMLLEAMQVENAEELGLVGEIKKVNKGLLEQFMQQGVIPVISPIAVDKNGQHYNINADSAAAAIAKSLQASLCVITDVDGVLQDDQVVHSLTDKEVAGLIDEKVITGGMIPKVQAALDCLKEGVGEVAIINGGKEHALYQLVQGKDLEGTTFYLEEAMKQGV